MRSDETVFIVYHWLSRPQGCAGNAAAQFFVQSGSLAVI